MMPGITNWPAASTTCASFGAWMEVPISAILPSFNKDGAEFDGAMKKRFKDVASG